MKFPCSKRTSESSNVICIDRHKHCDGTKDCPNGEDEERCVDISPNVIDHHSRAAIRQSNGAILAAKGPARYHLNCSFDDLVDGLCPCYTQHNETIICKNSNLTAIPVGLSDTIRILNLEFNAIEVIDSHVINQYGNLSVVSFRGNKLTRIESETFQSLSKLKRLLVNLDSGS
ncbi:hypothetical protein HDE_10744 [Halotydeus destructor]|nr:hypothetical protein HDE_10744 [Halotydeus destructor]